MNREREFIIRNNEICIPRLLPNNRVNRLISITKRQKLDTVNIYQAVLGEDEIEIQVRIMLVPRTKLCFLNELQEYVGTMIAVGKKVVNFIQGDRVISIGKSSMASKVRIIASHTGHIPDHMAYTAAAALPLALMTAHYALFDLVHMQPSQ